MLDTLFAPALRQAYLEARLKPTDLVHQIADKIFEEDTHFAWIRRLSRSEMLAYAEPLLQRDPAELPLYGIPFAIKDNLDLAGIATTAACPDFAYTPQNSAYAVQRLIDAGAIPVGKTNLDQFATGLVGVRSPYGESKNSINPEYIAGGSSSGSALAVALGYVSFSLGTDTAGSGRVPAAFNQLIGIKPSCGLVSTQGLVPACRSLDCVSIFCQDISTGKQVLQSIQGHDPQDAYSRQAPSGFSLDVAAPDDKQAPLILGIPQAHQLAFFGNLETPILFRNAVQQAVQLGWQIKEIDFAPFLETAQLLYQGPWVAERYAAIAELIEKRPQALYPVTRKIIAQARQFTAVDTFRAFYRLKALQMQIAPLWQGMHALLTPTAGTIYRIAEIEADPVQTNTNLGYYTNFVNLLDLSAIALPAGKMENGMPFGVTFSAPAFEEARLLEIGRQWMS